MYQFAEKSKLSTTKSAASVQRKIKVGKANDSYEREADRVADRVVSMSAPAAVQRKCAACAAEEKVQQKPIVAGITPLVQRQESEEEEVQTRRLQLQDEKEEIQPKQLQRQEEGEEVQPKRLQRQAEEEEVQSKLLQRQAEEEEVQTKRFSGSPSVTRSVESTLKGSKSGGQAMDPNTRNFMESRFGTDFSGVKIHADGQAVQMNQQLNAQAFTHGNHIYFNSGKYSPESNSGKHLLAHELTHTVQQGGIRKKPIQRVMKSISNASGDGWLTVKHASGGTYPPLPQYLKVDHNNTRDSREYFIIKESGQNGSLVDEKASVKKKAGGSYLNAAASYDGSATVTFKKSKRELMYGSKGPIETFTDPDNPMPDGTHDIEIPNEVHKGGQAYIASSKYAKTWFRVGHSGDRFLHPGSLTAGCATVKETSKWTDIYNYLIKSRKGDKKSVGTIKVTS